MPGKQPSARWYVLQLDIAARGRDCWRAEFGPSGRTVIRTMARHSPSGHPSGWREIIEFEPWTLEQALRAMGCECWSPLTSVQVRKGRGDQARMVWAPTPAMPGYLFVRCVLTGPLWHAISTLPPVLGFLKAVGADTPGSVPDELMTAMLAKDGSPAPEEGFKAGDTVRIVSGPFCGLLASLRRVDNRRGLHMLAELLDSSLSIELPREALQQA